MKANAPERIWIDPASDLPKLSGHIDKDSVEYIRKDAFIEKACNWLEQTLSPYISYCNIDIDLAIEDFKKYMEGE